MTQWSFFCATEIESTALKISTLSAEGKLATDAGREDAEVHARLLRRPFGVLEKHFEANDYAVGGRFTAADVNMAEIVRYASPYTVLMDPIPPSRPGSPAARPARLQGDVGEKTGRAGLIRRSRRSLFPGTTPFAQRRSCGNKGKTRLSGGRDHAPVSPGLSGDRSGGDTPFLWRCAGLPDRPGKPWKMAGFRPFSATRCLPICAQTCRRTGQAEPSMARWCRSRISASSSMSMTSSASPRACKTIRTPAGVLKPKLRFEGETGEQRTMFVYDPSGNALKFKLSLTRLISSRSSRGIGGSAHAQPGTSSSRYHTGMPRSVAMRTSLSRALGRSGQAQYTFAELQQAPGNGMEDLFIEIIAHMASTRGMPDGSATHSPIIGTCPALNRAWDGASSTFRLAAILAGSSPVPER